MARRRSSPPGLGPAALLPVFAVLVAACGNSAPTARPTTGITVVPSARPAAAIPQPAPPEGLALAPESARVDLQMPAFSNPTAITNPLFPVSRQASVLMLGRVDNKPFRTEVTLLPYTRVIDWQGLRVETVVSQYNAFLDGRITEIAYDFYAQADDGSVWYFGEDVYDFVDGAIVTTEGTWLAGKDAPAAMIMPGQPRVGDVYRPENAPGFVFEEVTVQAVDQVLDGPLGPIPGGLLAHELHRDGGTEDKIFAPGYGEFLTGGNGDVEALAMAVPTDALTGAVPADLVALSDRSSRVFDLAESARWAEAAAEVNGIRDAWSSHPKGDVPKPIEPLMAETIARLVDAVGARDAGGTRGASIEVARLAFDLQLRYRPPVEIDLARFDLWAAQVLVDAAADDPVGVNADVFALDYARDRFVRTLDASVATRLNALLGELQAAVIDDDLEASAQAAAGLRTLIKSL